MTEPARRLTAKGQATRDRIVRSAAELIAVHGVAGLSTEQVRETAGVSGSQLYHYFASRQALVRAVITRQADTFAGTGQPLMGPLDSLEALQAWADAAVERQAQDGGRGECDLGTLAGELHTSDEESRTELTTGFLRWKGVLRDGLQRMCERGDLRPDADLDELALALLAALQGGALLSQTLGNAEAMRASLNAALTHVGSFATDAGASRQCSVGR